VQMGGAADSIIRLLSGRRHCDPTRCCWIVRGMREADESEAIKVSAKECAIAGVAHVRAKLAAKLAAEAA